MDRPWALFELTSRWGDIPGERWRSPDTLVDPGSTYTWVPRAVLTDVGIAPQFRREFETADGRVVLRDMAIAMARLEGQTLPPPVVYADGNDAALLGVVTPEEFGLGVDPTNQRLVPIRGLAMRSLRRNGRLVIEGESS